MQVNYDYLAKVRGMIGLYTRKRTSNVLEGGFSSVFHGRSLEFIDLQEYQPGEDVHDIDWKSSSRTGKTLIRRYMAEKKHNVLFAVDTGKQMSGHTPAGERKSDVAMMCIGTVGYLVDRQGADIALSYNGEDGRRFGYFRSGQQHLELLLHEYERVSCGGGNSSFGGLLEYAAERMQRRMIMFVITDLKGIAAMDERLLKRLTYRHDVLVIHIADAPLFGERVYDVDGGRYELPYLLRSSVLRDAEARERDRIYQEAERRFAAYRVQMVSVSSESAIIDKTMELFDRYRRSSGPR